MTSKILMVDDEEPMRRLLQMTLEDFENEGVELLVAENGQEALEIIEKERPNLVFLDVMMPGMNGFEVCERVKHTLAMDDVTIILLTAKGQEIDRRRGEEVGADMYITKPFDPDELYVTAARILEIDMS